MSTLTEIELAARQLTRREQEMLLRRLEVNIRPQPNTTSDESAEEWMSRLEALSRSISTGRQTLTSEQIIEELREERL